jgi:hypothetical protein
MSVTYACLPLRYRFITLNTLKIFHNTQTHHNIKFRDITVSNVMLGIALLRASIELISMNADT